MLTFLSPSVFKAPVEVIPSEFRNDDQSQKTRMLWLSESDRISTIN